MRQYLVALTLWMLLWPSLLVAKTLAPTPVTQITAIGHIALHIREALTTHPTVKILDAKASAVQQRRQQQTLIVKTSSSRVININVILPRLSHLQLQQGASAMLFKRKKSPLAILLKQAGDLRIDGDVDLRMLQGSGEGQIYIPSLTNTPLRVKLNWLGDVTLAGDKLGLTSYYRQGDGNTTITGIHSDKLAVTQLGNGNIRLDGTLLGLTQLLRRGDGNLYIGHLGKHAFSATINNDGNTVLAGEAINLRALNYQGSGNITVNHLQSDLLDLSTNAASTSMIRLIGRVNLRQLQHLGQSHLYFTDVASQRLDLHAKGQGDIEINGAVQPHDINIGGHVRLKLDKIDTKRLDIRLSGQSQLFLRGRASTVNADLHGQSLLAAYYFSVKTLHVKTSGQAKAHVMVSDNLYAKASGASMIYYYRQPAFLSPSMQGAGSVLPLFKHAPPYPIWWRQANEYRPSQVANDQYEEDKLTTDSLMPPQSANGE